MPGRLQKVAALAAATWGFAYAAFAQQPNGPGASLDAISALESHRDRTSLELSQANAIERWSLQAASYRGAWDFSDTTGLPFFDWRSAIAGDVSRAGLTFDWQRRTDAGRVDGALIGRLARTGLSDGAALQRLRDSSFGAVVRWSSGASVFGAGFRSNNRDAERGIANAAGAFERSRLDRLGESSYSVFASTRAPFGGDFFVTLRRGAGRDGAALAALTDPRSPAVIREVDPLANSEMVEIGFRRRLPLGIETTVSMFRAASDLQVLLTGENAITQFSRATVRRGVQVAARYEPASWLAIDLQATALHARFADGAAEYVPGAAERSASAAATVRAPGGWNASLLVSYLGKRAGIDEDSSLRASTFVNARLSRKLSKNTRMSFDVLNVFDQRLRDVDYFSASRLSTASGANDGYLFNPAEARGFRLRLRTTF